MCHAQSSLHLDTSMDNLDLYPMNTRGKAMPLSTRDQPSNEVLVSPAERKKWEADSRLPEGALKRNMHLNLHSPSRSSRMVPSRPVSGRPPSSASRPPSSCQRPPSVVSTVCGECGEKRGKSFDVSDFNHFCGDDGKVKYCCRLYCEFMVKD